MRVHCFALLCFSFTSAQQDPAAAAGGRPSYPAVAKLPPQGHPDYPRVKQKHKAAKAKGKGKGPGPLNQPVVVSPDGPGGAARPFVYNHVAKTGGSFVKNVLHDLFGSKVTFLEEWHGLKAVSLPTEGPKRPFVVGAIRHPCEYYVSLWAFTSGGIVDVVVGSLPALREFGGRDKASDFSTPADIARFRQWVKKLSGPKFNLLSTRFWFSYFKERNPCKPWKGEVCVGEKTVYNELAEEIAADLRGMDVHQLADCWIQTSNLEPDFEKCLRQYETVTGVPIDWAQYAKLKATMHHNKSKRARCKEYYDEQTMAFVMKRDKYIMEKFGYETCCPEDDADSEPEKKAEL